MNLRKLRIEKFTNIKLVNFPEKYDMGIEMIASDADVDVVIYYIDEISDIEKFLSYNAQLSLSADNRMIMIYEKGRKDGVSRDSIMQPFKEGLHPEYRLKAPMLCSISDELSAVVLLKFA